LKIIDGKSTERVKINSKQVGPHKSSHHASGDDANRYGGNITFESLSAIAKIFSNDFKANEDSELDFEEDRMHDSNIEEVTEDDASEMFDKRKSQPDFVGKNTCSSIALGNQKENIQSNVLLINAIKNAQQNKNKPDVKAMCNSVIIEGEKSTLKQKPRQGKRQGMSTLQRKFTVKNKKESDSLIVYNEDYRDQVPKKRQTMAGKARASASRRSGKESKHEGRLSSRRPLKPYTGHKPSHKRSQSLNKSTIEQRYRSVPQSGYQYEVENNKRNYTKKKLN
jgi:hypothetical protein